MGIAAAVEKDKRKKVLLLNPEVIIFKITSSGELPGLNSIEQDVRVTTERQQKLRREAQRLGLNPMLSVSGNSVTGLNVIRNARYVDITFLLGQLRERCYGCVGGHVLRLERGPINTLVFRRDAEENPMPDSIFNCLMRSCFNYCWVWANQRIEEGTEKVYRLDSIELIGRKSMDDAEHELVINGDSYLLL